MNSLWAHTALATRKSWLDYVILLLFISVAWIEIYYFCTGPHSGTVISYSIAIAVLTLAFTVVCTMYVCRRHSRSLATTLAVFSGSLTSIANFVATTRLIVDTAAFTEDNGTVTTTALAVACFMILFFILLGVAVLAVTLLAVPDSQEECTDEDIFGTKSSTVLV